MVCIPCIILPVALWVYCKFIQPLILRWMPPTWRTWLDNLLYPTCPVKLPPTKEPITDVTDHTENRSEVENGELKRRKVGSGSDERDDGIGSCCRQDEDQKSPLATLESNGRVVVGGPDKKID